MHIYCIFCQTQKTQQIATIIEQTKNIRCISPKIVQRYWVKGTEEHRIHDYLPGYLFLYSEEAIETFRDVNRISGVLRRLGSSETGYELMGTDRSFAEMLLDMDGCIGILQGIEEGSRVRLNTEIYHGFTGRITRLDRRKGRAQIEFDFDGQIYKVWVGLDIVQKEAVSEADHTAESTD